MPILTLSESPNTQHGYTQLPVANCYKFVIEASAEIYEQLPETPAFFLAWANGFPMPNGDSITIAGFNIISDSTVPNNIGGSKANMGSNNGLTNLANLKAAVENHPILSDLIEMNVFLLGSQPSADILWKKPTEFQTFSEGVTLPANGIGVPSLGFSSLGNVGVLLKDASLVYRFECAELTLTDGTQYVPITGWQALPAMFGKDCYVKPFTVELGPDVLQKLTSTKLPNCDDLHTWDVAHEKLVSISYGLSIAKDDGCGNEFCEIQRGQLMGLANYAWNVELRSLEDHLNRYFYSNNSYLFPMHFQTSKPSGATICKDVCDWLWIHVTDSLVGLNQGNLSIRYIFYDGAGVELLSEDVPVSDTPGLTRAFGALVIPSGPANVLNELNGTVVLAEVCRYTVAVVWQPEPTTNFTAVFSEVYEYRIDHNCCCATPAYFLDPEGGITHINLGCLSSLEATSSFKQLCLGVDCGSSYDEALLGSKIDYDSSTLTVYNYMASAKEASKSADYLAYYKAFKASPAKYVMIDGKWKRMLAGESNTVIYLKDGVVRLQTSLIEANEYKILTS